ncbi:MAG: succinate dehydrogenase assembly factor 2 [Betaproteobacteria bacterium]|nr:succinate dehydrogenase assembly factor 2 [Betaproteobacteria bacterium]
MKELERIRWRCRRGLLELDLVLMRFLDAHYEGLSEADRRALAELLDYPDVDLWHLVSGRAELDLNETRLKPVLEKLRAS